MHKDKHPLLERAGIDDPALATVFNDRSMCWVAAPDLTFQYSAEGQLDTSFNGTRTPLCEDAPAIYRDRFIRFWSGTRQGDGLPNRDGEACWERLRDLVAKAREKLPDNPCLAEDAWLVGLTSDMPPGFRNALDGLYKYIDEYRKAKDREAAIVERAKSTRERQPLRSWMTDGCCNGNADCSFDNAVEYVMPDGSRTTEYHCCY
jgi:hypothetical protein